MFGFDERTRALLRALAREGNVSAAARAVGLDPANARRHLATAARRHGARLVASRRGGRGGRNSALTAAGRRFAFAGGLVGVAGAYDEEAGTTPLRVGARTLHAAGRRGPGRVEVRIPATSVGLERARSGVVGSARNRLPMRVQGIDARADGTFLVSLVAGSLRLESLIVRGAMRDLRLRQGSRVVAVVKAVAIETR